MKNKKQQRIIELLTFLEASIIDLEREHSEADYSLIWSALNELRGLTKE